MPNTNELINEALGLIDKADYKAVEKICAQLLAANENDFRANYLLGYSYHLSGDLPRAVAVLEKAKQLSPDNIEVFNTLGCVQRKMADYENAKTSFSEAILLNPLYVNAHINLGLVYLDKKLYADAEEALLKALQLKPDSALCYASLGDLYRKQNANSLAIEYYKTALTFNPSLFDVYANLGVVYKNNNNFEDAALCFQQALKIQPDSILTKINLASTQEQLGDFNAAKAIYTEVLKLEESSKSLTHAGVSIRVFGQDIAVTSKHISYNIGIIDLLQENFAEAWPRYHYRPHRTSPHVIHAIDDKLRENLSGKKLLITQEQGIGDEIFFLRFLKPLKQKNVHISYLPHPRLANLLSNIPEIDNIVLSEFNPNEYDVVFSVADLPYLLQVDATGMIPEPLTLMPKSYEIKKMRDRLPQLGTIPHIAITWRSGSEKTAEHQHTLYKEVPFNQLVDALKTTSCNIVVIQREPKIEELSVLRKAFGTRLIECHDVNYDMDAMLALVSLIDSYVAVSNTNVYLRAGVAKPSHILVPFPSDWRWTEKCEISPWFPKNVIYREDATHCWDQALAALSSHLIKTFPA